MKLSTIDKNHDNEIFLLQDKQGSLIIAGPCEGEDINTDKYNFTYEKLKTVDISEYEDMSEILQLNLSLVIFDPEFSKNNEKLIDGIYYGYVNEKIMNPNAKLIDFVIRYKELFVNSGKPQFNSQRYFDDIALTAFVEENNQLIDNYEYSSENGWMITLASKFFFIKGTTGDNVWITIDKNVSNNSVFFIYKLTTDKSNINLNIFFSQLTNQKLKNEIVNYWNKSGIVEASKYRIKDINEIGTHLLKFNFTNNVMQIKINYKLLV